MVEEARNQVAAQRGPIVYCLESVDLPGAVSVDRVAISPTIPWKSRFAKELLGGSVILEGEASVLADGDWNDTLYRDVSPQRGRTIEIDLIPYYAWANRGQSEMTVWMPSGWSR